MLIHKHVICHFNVIRDVSPLVEVNLSLFAHHIRETATNSLDGSDGKWNLVASINVRVENTEDVLELVLREDKSHLESRCDWGVLHGRCLFF